LANWVLEIGAAAAVVGVEVLKTPVVEMAVLELALDGHNHPAAHYSVSDGVAALVAGCAVVPQPILVVFGRFPSSAVVLVQVFCVSFDLLFRCDI